MNWGEMQKAEEKADKEECKRNAKIDRTLDGQKTPPNEYIIRKLRAVC
jgi:hypothetical protein